MRGFVFFPSTALYFKNIQSRGFYHALSYFLQYALQKTKILASKGFRLFKSFESTPSAVGTRGLIL